MKYQTFFLILIVSVLLMSYDPVSEPPPTLYKPILLEREVLESSITFEPEREINSPGKIYIYQNYLFINEKYKGIHVFDNSNPESPVKIGFVKIPGSVDIAIKDNILYADNAVDLIAVDITNVQNPVTVKRIKNAFPQLTPPGQNWIPYQYDVNNRPQETVIIEWVEK